METLRNLLRIAAVALVAAAVYEELKKPPDKREWHGRIADLIPYDLRPPTVERLRKRFWNPEDPRIFTEHAFGVGWSVNFYTVLQRLQTLRKEPDTPTSEDTP
ncbi:MAG: DUF5808 domain-containing protein [Dehalococcoidia bacterium]